VNTFSQISSPSYVKARGLKSAESSVRLPNNGATDRQRAIKTALSLFVLGLLVRVVFLFITPNNAVDAWARYMYAVGWLRDPTSLPPGTATDAWLPLHFWLLGGAIWLWHSEWSARILTALLGALTVPLFWGAIRRAFGNSVALFASLALALFGFHIGYSVSTSSEVPTIFFLVCGLYCWTRFYSEQTWRWAWASGLSFDAAALCRFEAWLVSPILVLLLLDYSGGWRSLAFDRRSWWNAVRFGIPAAAGPAGWMLFSWWKWGDPMMLPHRTLSDNAGTLESLRHGFLYRTLVVPGTLTVSMSPVLIGLAVLGLFLVFYRGNLLSKATATLAITLFTFHYFNSVRHDVTQAKYTLVYNWLFFPLAFFGLERIAVHRVFNKRSAGAAVIVFFFAWQAAIALGALWAPPVIGDRLAVMSPLLPPRAEIRDLVAWLKIHRADSDAVILDEFNYEGIDVARFSGIDANAAFIAKMDQYRDPELARKISDFTISRNPRWLICSPDGPIGRALLLDSDTKSRRLFENFRIERQWQGPHWLVFAINTAP